ncbi:MAG: tetratricopeptide repeat protein [Anaerolineae bacterium]|nr:tetratricopeptide repeat protein [Anaerolineae bacterium]
MARPKKVQPATVPEPDSKDANATSVTLLAQLEQALEHYNEPLWLGTHSPLAAPYLLGNDILREKAPAVNNFVSDMSENAAQQRGLALQRRLHSTAQALPVNAEKGYDPYKILLLTYFKVNQQRTQAGIATELAISPATYYRYRGEALAQLEQALLRQWMPSLRLETPQAPPLLVGREAIVQNCQAALAQGRVVALTGSSGFGKSSVGAALAAAWQGGVFWFTLRRGFNDKLSALLFSLGLFLHQHEKSGLWQQLLADGGRTSPELALSLAALGLSQLPQPALLVFDEIDLLQPNDTETDEQVRLRGLIEALIQRTRLNQPILLIGQQLLIAPDVHQPLSGLHADDVAKLLRHANIQLSQAEQSKLENLVNGNPLMLKLLIALHQTGEPLSKSLQMLASAPTLGLIFNRVWRYLNEAERYVMMTLAAFPNPAPSDAWRAGVNGADANPRHTQALATLSERGYVQAANGTVALQPALRHIALRQLSGEDRQACHLFAAQTRAARAEYTAAAYHYLEAAQPALAMWIWFAHREQEIGHGQAGLALELFSNVSSEQLNEQDRRTLHILRSELWLMVGDSERASAELNANTDVRGAHPLGSYVYELQARALQMRGQSERALEQYRQSLALSGRQLERMQSNLHTRIGAIYKTERNLAQARHEAQLARFEAERFMGEVEEEHGDYVKAQHHHQLALDIADEIDYKLGQAKAHFNLGTLMARLEDLNAALNHFEYAVKAYRRLGDVVREHTCMSNLAAMHVQAEQFDAALAPAQTALGFFEHIQYPFWVAMNAGNLAEAYLGLGQFEQAEQLAMRALNTEEVSNRPYALTTLAQLRRQQQRHAEAERLCQQALDCLSDAADKFAEAPARRALGEVYLAQGRSAESRAAFEQSLALYTQLGLRREAVRVRGLMGVYVE